jgi:hypothetical protein
VKNNFEVATLLILSVALIAGGCTVQPYETPLEGTIRSNITPLKIHTAQGLRQET